MDAVTTFKYSKLPVNLFSPPPPRTDKNSATGCINKNHIVKMLKLVPPCTTPELPDIKVLQQTEMLEKMKVLKKHGSSIYSDVLETLHEIKVET